MNAVTTTTPADQFRAKADRVLIEAANMTLHELVDEFQRLTNVMDENTVRDAGHIEFNDTAELAQRERRLVAGAARARFGISFEAYDRPSSNYFDF